MANEELAEFCSDSNNVGSSACTCYFQLQSIQDVVEEKIQEYQEATEIYLSMKSTWDSAKQAEKERLTQYWENKQVTGDCTTSDNKCTETGDYTQATGETSGNYCADISGFSGLMPVFEQRSEYRCKLPAATIDSYVTRGATNPNGDFIDGLDQWVDDNPEPSPPNDYTPEIDAACCANEISDLTNVNASNVVQNCEASIVNDYISDSGEAIDNPDIDDSDNNDSSETTLDTCYTDSGCSGFLMQCDTDSSTCKRNNTMLGLIIGGSSLVVIIIIVIIILLIL